MLCSIVIPVYNEEANIFTLYQRITDVFSSNLIDYEIIFVDDGSTDSSLDKIKELSEKDKRVYYISLTRNFGHEAVSRLD